MKEIKSMGIAFTYAGCIIGAGFLSGQELWQFFGSYGKLGIVGFILAMILQIVLCSIIFIYARRSQIKEFDLLIAKAKPVRWFFVFSEAFFIFGVLMVMFAGAGPLIKTVFGLNELLGSIIFAVIVTVATFGGFEKMVKILQMTIPFLTVVTIIISILAFNKYGFPNISNAEVTGKTVLMPNFIVAFILFAVHNIFCILGVLVPLGNSMDKDSSAVTGMTLASIVCTLITFSVLMPIYSAPEFASFDLPMLELTKTISTPLFFIYGILLLTGMFGSALSHFIAIVDFSAKKSQFFSSKKNLIITITAIVAFLLSRFGFSELISVLYPLSGYIGIVALTLIIIKFIKFNKANR